ncbi:hypothetical protein A3Q56_08042 [Intoshia linei]|uniref:Uncharacterized protein n=1 Tax=Intoshia linei TaxID=1819745 RepID=A0A177ASA1_9BILA|nr:hypothetical protein A3Q56_08042 [Intoshia linei]
MTELPPFRQDKIEELFKKLALWCQLYDHLTEDEQYKAILEELNFHPKPYRKQHYALDNQSVPKPKPIITKILDYDKNNDVTMSSGNVTPSQECSDVRLDTPNISNQKIPPPFIKTGQINPAISSLLSVMLVSHQYLFENLCAADNDKKLQVTNIGWPVSNLISNP